MVGNINEIWKNVLLTIEEKSIINKQSFDIWLKNTSPYSYEQNILKIKVQDEVAKKHINNTYSQLLTELVRNITNESIHCEFIVTNDFNSKNLENNEKSINQNNNLSIDLNEDSKIGLNPKYTFENFVIGPNNLLAHAAAVAVSRDPAKQHNPLFIYGGTGLGKSHLMQAIAHHIIKEKPYLKVKYVSMENYLNDFVKSIQNNTQDSFKIKYRNIDILLIDDIQFLESKIGTQEEFFHTFNDLYNNGKQIVITSDRPPKEINRLEERLRTRFEWGLIADIQTPNIETREAILRKKAEMDNINIDIEVISYIARRIESSIRPLEAALNRLKVISEIYNEPINIQMAKIQLKEIFTTSTAKKVTPEDIIRVVGDKYNLSYDDFISSSRHNRIAHPRFIAMYLCRKMTNLTTVEIGKEFGKRDHSTVLHAVDKIEKMIKENYELKENIDEIIMELNN